MAEKFLVALNDDQVTYELDRSGPEPRVRREGSDEWHNAHLERIGGTDLYLLLIDNRPTELYLERKPSGAIVTLGRHTFDVAVRPWRAGVSLRRRLKPTQAGLMEVRAPMAGTIIEVRCTAGESIEEGEIVLVMEAMKMNNEVKAPAAGEIADVKVSPGSRVNAGDVLLNIRAGGGTKD